LDGRLEACSAVADVRIIDSEARRRAPIVESVLSTLQAASPGAEIIAA
jgi:hypothetical protein